MKKLFLIDGNSLLHRAFHAIPPLTAPSGEPVNAVFGFASMLMNIVQTMHPDYMAVAFDSAKKTFRHDAFPEYKATRKKAPQELYDQIPKIKEFVRIFEIPIFEAEGYEADDLLGTLAKKAATDFDDIQVVIVTGDLDTLQLVNDKISVAAPLKGFREVRMYNRDKVVEKLGITPSQVVDFKALKGDASDNIPGVPGVGEKTAVQLLKKYDNLDNIYNHLREIREVLSKKLEQGKELAFLSQKLATIHTDSPASFQLQTCKTHSFERDEVRIFFEQLNFHSLLKKLGYDPSMKISAQQGTLF